MVDVRRIDIDSNYYYYESFQKADIYTCITKVKDIQSNTIFDESKPFCKLLRLFTNNLSNNIPVIKKEACKKYDISSRMYNTLIKKAQANIDSAKECAKLELERVTNLLEKKQEQYLIAKQKNKLDELPGRLRRIDRLKSDIIKYKNLIEKPKVFYGRKYFKKQNSCKEWKEAYLNNRNNEVGYIGSKDELSGCTIKLEYLYSENNYETFQIKYKRKIVGIFRLKKKEAVDLIKILQKNNQPFKMLTKPHTTKPGKVTKYKDTTGRTAITVFFRKRNNKWCIYVSYKIPRKSLNNINNNNNLLGVDLNVDSIAYSLVKDFENKPEYKTLYFSTQGSNDRTALLCKYVREIVDLAKQNNATVVLEYLDFESSKKYLHNKLGSLLHTMPYKKIRGLFERRCAEAGVVLRYVRSSYTSLLGGIFSEKYPELNRDVAAATVIALRGNLGGNNYLNNLCSSLLLKRSFRIRYNSKSRYGINLVVAHTDSHGNTQSGVSENLMGLENKDLNVQYSLGRVVSATLKTLNKLYYKTKDIHLLKQCLTTKISNIEYSTYFKKGAPLPFSEPHRR